MTIFACVLVGLYALLNVVLAVAGWFQPEAREARFAAVLLPTALFALAAISLAIAMIRAGSGSALIFLISGLVLASAAPVLYGAGVEHSNALLHHLVRAAFAAAILVVWLIAWRTR